MATDLICVLAIEQLSETQKDRLCVFVDTVPYTQLSFFLGGAPNLYLFHGILMPQEFKTAYVLKDMLWEPSDLPFHRMIVYVTLKICIGCVEP